MIPGLKEELDDIERTLVFVCDLEKVDQEETFVGIGVNFLIETGSLVCVAASILPDSENRWTRDQAIVGRHIVRLFKLIDAILDQTCKHRRETTFVLGRLAFETIVNLIYLAKEGTAEVFNSYVRYSMRHEKKLFDRIQSNIRRRLGEALPIEQRMLASIRHTAEVSGVPIETIHSSSPRNWADRNLYEKAKAVGLDLSWGFRRPLTQCSW